MKWLFCLTLTHSDVTRMLLLQNQKKVPLSIKVKYNSSQDSEGVEAMDFHNCGHACSDERTRLWDVNGVPVFLAVIIGPCLSFFYGPYGYIATLQVIAPFSPQSCSVRLIGPVVNGLDRTGYQVLFLGFKPI